MTKIAIINAKVLDFNGGRTDSCNLLLAGGKIVGMGYIPDEDESALETIDGSGCWILPHPIDGFAQTGEPDNTHRQTGYQLASDGLSSGVVGAVVAAMPPTSVDRPEALLGICRSRNDFLMAPLGAITVKNLGQQLAELGLMAESGAVGFYDGRTLSDPRMMVAALTYAAWCGRPLVVLPQDRDLAGSGVSASGSLSAQLGLRSIGALAEQIAINRDIEMASEIGAHVHFSMISAEKSVATIRRAKSDGVRVTCGVSIHHLVMNESAISSYATDHKFLPPLRSESDQVALQAGVADGTIDMIVSGHTPICIDDKRADFTAALPGTDGIGRLIPLAVTDLVGKFGLSPLAVFRGICVGPKAVFRLAIPEIAIGKSPSFSLIDRKNGECKLTVINGRPLA